MPEHILSGAPAGVLSYQQIREGIRRGMIASPVSIKNSQIQPSSMDLRLGPKGWRIRSSFLPQNRKVTSTMKELKMYDIDLSKGAILEKGNVYLIPLLESVNLPDGVHARTNPKSSTGRLDIFTRVISDYSHRFEEIRPGYGGGLYLEVVPRSFTIMVKAGLALNQIRFLTGDTQIDDDGIIGLHREKPLLYLGKEGKKNPMVRDGLFVSIEVHTENENRIIGYMAKKNSTVIDLTKVGRYYVRDFWEPIKSPHENFLILEPEEFYIFASKEKVRVPMNCAAEMVEFDAGSGELRTHYAGFFDSGFGDGHVQGTKAVLEVRPHDVPFRIEDGQLFFKLRYERMSQTPAVGYGADLGSNYYNQGLKLSKHFLMKEH